jgi:glycosyltransferase involved in cell wall biosynthesis
MYAGCISKQYGLGDLVEAFRKADIPGAQLHLYGPCDYPEELKQIAAEDPRIVYGGMLLNTEIVDKEMEATLLVNPRPTHEEFTKYSFPSKTMEYMSTGTPVLTTKLPGMPQEYYPHVYFIETETVDGIVDALHQTLSYSDDALFEKGSGARNFVLDCRNNVMQAAKILKMLEK